MSLATAEIHCTICQRLSGATEDCSIVRGRQLRTLCRERCCMSASLRMFGSLWNAVAAHAHEHRQQDGSRRPGTVVKCQTATGVKSYTGFRLQPKIKMYDLEWPLARFNVSDSLNPTKMAKYSLVMTPTPCRVARCITSIRPSYSCARALTYLLTYTVGSRPVQENSAKLTNQRVSYAFTSSPFSIHVRHILPTSKFQHSYSCILLIFYRHDQRTACVRTVSVKLWTQFTGYTF